MQNLAVRFLRRLSDLNYAVAQAPQGTPNCHSVNPSQFKGSMPGIPPQPRGSIS